MHVYFGQSAKYTSSGTLPPHFTCHPATTFHTLSPPLRARRMQMASLGAVNPPPSHGPAAIRAEDLARVDISLLSQSELQALSLCSASARRSDDVVFPQLNRSVFNESAGSRRQTYSRIHHRSHSRLPRLHQPHSYPQHSSDPVTHSIVHFLKHFLKGDHNPPPPPPPPPPLPQDSPKAAAAEVGFLGLQENVKLKRNRARRGGNLENRELQRVNGKGEIVDFAELGEKGDELYGDELKRRTAGLETEEAILGVLGELEGEWCSRRKKRKYVDAGVFGDALPAGWKLLLSLRRRGYRVSVYCRRYIRYCMCNSRFRMFSYGCLGFDPYLILLSYCISDKLGRICCILEENVIEKRSRFG